MGGWRSGEYDPWQESQARPVDSDPRPAHEPRRYQPQPYRRPRFAPRRRKSWAGQHKVVTGFLALCGLVFAIAVGSALGSSSTTSLTFSAAQTQGAVPALPASTAAAAAAKKQTVSYVVTGSAADVSYGPAGSDFAGTVPLQVTQPLGTPIYYRISAQLQGGGTVSCQVKVDGKAISSATASGGHNIASCEITQDPFSGDWTDANGG
jgi:hypothetical protein